jgi:hypothetical protein
MNPTGEEHQLSITRINQATYAIAAVRGPWDTKVAPVESTLGPWIRVGYESRLIIVTPPIKFIIYSAKAASNFLVSEKGSRNKTDSLVCENHGVRLRLNTYWQCPGEQNCRERFKKKHLWGIVGKIYQWGSCQLYRFWHPMFYISFPIQACHSKFYCWI